MARMFATVVIRSILVLVFIGYPLWVMFPREKYSFERYQAIKAASERYSVVQARAESPETNGYLSPELFKWWAIRDKATPGQPAELAITAWNDYSGAFTGEEVDHAGLLERQDASYLKARGDFERYLPDINRAFNAEVFVVPDERPTHESQVVNFLAMRATAMAVVGYVESKVAEGQTGQALEALGQVFLVGARLQEGGAMINVAIGMSIQRLAFDALVSRISPGMGVSSGDWLRLAQVLQRCVPPEGALVQALETEAWVLDNSFEAGGLTKETLTLPGLVSRERRICNNVTAQLIEATRQERLKDLAWMDEPSSWDFFTGRVGVMSTSLITGPGWIYTNDAHLVVNRRTLIGASAVAGILAYREQHGRLPESLDDLELELADRSFLRYDPQGTLLVEIPSDKLEATRVLESEVKSTWFGWTPEGARFTL